jgi:hypothetical protein
VTGDERLPESVRLMTAVEEKGTAKRRGGEMGEGGVRERESFSPHTSGFILVEKVDRVSRHLTSVLE